MATTRKPFLLRMDPELFAALQKWADDELRSLNGQIEFLLRRALASAGRSPRRSTGGEGGEGTERPPENETPEPND